MSFSVGRRFSAAPRRVASQAGGAPLLVKHRSAHSTDARPGDNALRNSAP